VHNATPPRAGLDRADNGGFENPRINLRNEYFTAENIVGLFEKYSVPMRFDHLTLDIDLNTCAPGGAKAECWAQAPLMQRSRAGDARGCCPSQLCKQLSDGTSLTAKA
jgi:hypothetical protein